MLRFLGRVRVRGPDCFLAGSLLEGTMQMLKQRRSYAGHTAPWDPWPAGALAATLPTASPNFLPFSEIPATRNETS